jgi:hypothetical protein
METISITKHPKMKIAFCLSGQPRFVEKGVDSFQKNILKNNNVDIFIHNWYDKNNKNKKFDSSQFYLDSKTGHQSEKTESILNNLSPKKIILEQPKNFEEFSHLVDLPTAKQTKLASMFYSMYRCNQLKKEYEHENGFIYDLVIKTRIDIEYNQQLDILKLINDNYENNIFCAKKYQECRMNDSYPTKSNFSYSSLSDTWLMGSSKNINICCEIYPNFEKIYNDIYPFVYAEAYLGYISRGINKISISTVDLEYNLIRE